ncbi:deacetylase [Planotetraspora silvatica]|uniref:Deacetylase n=1 Tax=Planotetraspora silvatica TaxID=234614 RepID=A0A8J3UI25_9ACTN|nr:deacetylase [Planotetraspora silvatica]GII46108.1 deacetylase [Planotetraspora silvatica]
MGDQTFLITVDVEADDAWDHSRPVTTENAACLPRFQAMCERHGLRPTYLADWTMACSPVFQAFGRSVVERDAGEIGMHLHAWTTPPFVPLTQDDHRCKPFLIDFPETVMAAKIETATRALETAFGLSPTSHRAGRWMLDAAYARLLIEHGYLTDCSVTPGVSWKGTWGAPGGAGPQDYSRFPSAPYFVDPMAVDRPGRSPLLEVPMTITPRRHPRPVETARRLVSRSGLSRRVWGRLFPETAWMRPNGRNLDGMLGLARAAREDGRDHVEFMLHSSELMPGGSPYFGSARAVEGLYRHLDVLFAHVSGEFEGRTLSEYRARFTVGTP